MLSVLLLTALGIFTLHYVYFITRVRLGLLALGTRPRSTDDPPVSIVIAARNEERRIAACLESLCRLDYPSGRLDVLVVDDDSDDRTVAVARTFEGRLRGLRVIDAETGAEAAGRGKTAALRRGIALALGEIILTTDADCVVPPRWVRSMVARFSNDVAMVSGPVREETRDTLLGRIESLEFLGLITTGAGLIGAGRPIICNGANLAYRRAAYEAVGGFTGTSDDESLMNAIVYRKVGVVAFADDPSAVVVTRSENTPGRFLRQRIRWAAKRGRYEDPSILVTLLLLYGFFLTVLLTAVLVPQDPLLALPLAVVLIGKAVIEWAALHSGARLFGDRVRLGPFLIAELLHVPYIVIAAALGQLVALRWRH